jgi:AsmA protein
MAIVPSGTGAKPRRARRVGRTILLVGLSVISLLALTLTLLPYLVSLEPVKDQIVARLETALQRKVEVGAVHLQLLNGLGVGFKDLTIDSPPGWPPARFLKVDTLSVKVAWWPLLQRRIEIAKVTLRGGEIVIERDAQGRFNIADLVPSEPAAKPFSPSSPSHQTQPVGQSSVGLQVSEVTLQEVTIAFVDQMVTPGQALTTSVSDVRLDLRDIALGPLIPFDLAATVFTDRQHNLRARGQLGPCAANTPRHGLPIAMHLQMTDILLRQLLPYLGSAAPLTQGRVNADVKMQGSIGGNLAMQGTLTLAEAVLRNPVRGAPPNSLPTLSAVYDMALDMADGRLQLAKTKVDLAGVQATIAGTVHHLMSTPRFDLYLSANSFAPGELLADLPMLASALPSPIDLHGRAQLQATLQGTPQDIRVEGQIDLQEVALKTGTFNGGRSASGAMRLETDDARAVLTLRAEHPRPPQLQMDVRAQRLAFDRQAAKGPGADSPKGPTPEPTAEAPPMQRVQPPVTLNGQINIAEGQIQGVNFQQMTAEVALINGALTSKQQAKVYTGSYQGDVQIDLAQKEPHYTLNAKLLDVNVGQALNELTSVNNALWGVLDTDVQLSGRGLTWDLISQTLTGDGALRLSEAKLTTFDLMPELVQVLREVGAMAGVAVSADWEHEAFNAIEGNVRLRQGKIWTDALKLRGQGLEAILKGYVGLDQSIDYAGTMFLPGKLIGERGPLALVRRDDMGRIIWPFAVKGAVKSPHIAFDKR